MAVKQPKTSKEDERRVGLQSFVGGMSTDQKYGQEFQFYYGRHIDFRKKPSQFSILPKTRKILAPTGLITGMTKVPSGKCYAVDDDGSIYVINTDLTSSEFGDLESSSAGGILYRQDADSVYLSTNTGMARIRAVSGSSPQLEVNWFLESKSEDVDAFSTDGGQVYNVKTSILNEGDSHRREFVSDIEPFIKIGIKIIAKGTGNWTLTLHDDANNELATATVVSANLNNNAINYFEFSSAIRALVSPNGRTYHFHLSSTVADGSIATSTKDSMHGADMELWANALVPVSNGLHPIHQFGIYTLIGNGRYVAVHEPLSDSPTNQEFQRHRLVLPSGYEVTGISQQDEFAVIAAEKKATTGEFQEGKLFYWDTISDTYNFFTDIPEGSPYSPFSHENILYWIAGNSLYRRVSSSSLPEKIRTFRNTDSEYSDTSDTTTVLPNMMAVRRGVLLAGFPSSTTNEALEHGVYSWGRIDYQYPYSFGFSYTISSGTILNDGSNNLEIGLVKNYGDKLFIAWGEDGAYGLDVVDNDSNPFESATIETLYFDNLQPYKQKKAKRVIATFKALPAGATLKLKYKIDHAAGWTYSEEYEEGDTFAKLPVEKAYYGIEWGMDLTLESGSTTTPEILSLHLVPDLLFNEKGL